MAFIYLFPELFYTQKEPAVFKICSLRTQIVFMHMDPTISVLLYIKINVIRKDEESPGSTGVMV